MMPGPVIGFLPIATERLVLRTLDAADASRFFSYRSDPRVGRFQSFRPKDPAESVSFIAGNTGGFGTTGTWYQLGIYLDGLLVGDLGLHFLEAGGRQCELGYTVAPDHQGKGYAREAVGALLGFLFDGLGTHRVMASVDPRNTASVALLEGLGFRKEGHFVKSVLVDGTWEDDLWYGLLDEEWKRGGARPRR
jgi:RimJ/RimL family protein N-acetyltransferase